MDNVDFPDKERGAPMVRGFVTIATGHERYYRMARNLLRSYRQNCSERVRFALIADRRNEYTEEFDDVVILENPANNWMDKLELLCNCPYDENIFIDADCLVYRDIHWQSPAAGRRRRLVHCRGGTGLSHSFSDPSARYALFHQKR